MKDIVNALHCMVYTAVLPHISDPERYPGVSECMSHIVLLLLIPAEYSYLFNTCVNKLVQHCIAKGTRSSGYKQCFSVKHCRPPVQCLNFALHFSTMYNASARISSLLYVRP